MCEVLVVLLPLPQLAQHGIIVAGTKYTFVQGSGDVIRGVRSYLVRVRARVPFEGRCVRGFANA